MTPRETEYNAYAKFGVTNKEHCDMLWYFLEWSIKFTWFILACCLVIFPTRCDLRDFLYPRVSTTKERT